MASLGFGFRWRFWLACAASVATVHVRVADGLQLGANEAAELPQAESDDTAPSVADAEAPVSPRGAAAPAREPAELPQDESNSGFYLPTFGCRRPSVLKIKKTFIYFFLKKFFYIFFFIFF